VQRLLEGIRRRGHSQKEICAISQVQQGLSEVLGKRMFP